MLLIAFSGGGLARRNEMQISSQYDFPLNKHNYM